MNKNIIKYSTEQKIIFIILSCFIIGCILLDLYITNNPSNTLNLETDSSFVVKISEFENSLESISSHKYFHKSEISIPKERFTFDPNSIDSTDLLRLGFKPFMAHNLINYRRHGGTIYDFNKFKTIYGIDTVLLDSLYTYITFPQRPVYPKHINSKNTHTKHEPKVYFNFEINSADTSILKKLPNIGEGRASMIVSYRDKLGGFFSAEQLYEIEEIPDSVISPMLKYITVNSDSIKKIAINHSNIKWLKKHPYINYYQAKAIYNLRWDNNHKGTLSLNDLFEIKEFSKEELEHLIPYLEF